MLRRADTPKKYEHIDFTPPESAAKAAEKGLEYREKASPSNKGGLTVSEASEQGIGSGVQRAVNLKNRNTLSPDTIKQMHGFFSRHEQNKGVAPEHKSEPWNDKGNVSWLLWGGDAAKSWVEKVLGQMEAADEKEKEKAVKKAARALEASTHEKSLALAKYLGQFAKREGVGQHVYVVGGAVRNFLLNQPIKDIDVVVDSVALRGYDSEKFARNLSRVLPAATSLVTNQYGVAILTVKGPWVLDGHDMQGEVIEIANARNESYGKTEGKGYKPSEVNPATIEEDVYRREFTFNTLLWRLNDLVRGPERAEIIDLTGCGRSDLERRVMRCPRDPDVVFSDDPTRMLRALKFAVKYGFDVPPDLQAAIKRNATKLAGVPHEAVGTLLVRDIFGTPRAREMLRFMEKLGLLDVIRDMVSKNKGFATYLSGQLSAHDAAFLLDMDDLNMGVRLPLNFLTPAQRVRVRDLLDSLPSDEAQAFVAALTRPVLDNNALIAQFSLKPQERGLLQPLAREALLDDPTLAAHPQELTPEVARRLERARGRTASLRQAAYFDVGDPILYGKFQNKPGVISRIWTDERGIPMIEIEPVPKGRKKSRIMGLFRIRHAPTAPVPVATPVSSTPAMKTASVEGQGTEVGFFIPLSADLASQYGVKPEDTSPPHVTFLYVGRVPADREAEFLAVARNVLQSAPPVFGVLNGVDSFVHEDKNRRVLYSRVSFSHDLRPLRDRLWEALTKAGFDVQHSFKDFVPHVTLEYRDGVGDAVWHGAAPSGSWECKTIEVWGLPQKYVLSFGAGRGRKASLDTVTYGNLTVEEEAEALSLSDVFTSDVLEQIPHRPFPANTSPETKAELAYLMRLQNTVRPYMAARVRLTDENSTETLEAYCAAHGLSTGDVLNVVQAARPVRLQLKRLYNRPRPYQLAAYIEPGFHPLSSTSVHTPAYPSGHSAQAVLAALLLSDMHPAHREAFMALAKEVGQHRMVGGFHFPSDVAYGEEVGRVLYECLVRASVRTAAAKYKDKKQVPKADGSGKTTVYVYSERQVANRQREKAERLEDFKPALADLRAQVKKDLDSDDPKKGLVALAVGLIDATYERVGNDESADKGHYGVTGWLRKHVTFKGNRAVIRYVGKSGVKHEKSVDDEALVGALKECCGDKDGEEQVLSLGKHAVSSDDVNEYLKPYGITAKDLRGLHANREMQERLRAIRSKGPKLPRLRKERDPILKDEFKEALEAAAEAVGHEPATLRKQYLVPGLEEAYMKDGTVPRDLTASTRVASLYLRATKSDAEREDEEAERLIKPEPKYKPPRGDLRRRRVETEGDADPDEAQDDKDRSQNYKDAAVRSAVQVATAAWLFRTAKKSKKKTKAKNQRLDQKDKRKEQAANSTEALQERAKTEFEAYKEKHPDTELNVQVFYERLVERAKAEAERRKSKDTTGDAGDASKTDEKHYAEREQAIKAEQVKKLVAQVSKDWDKTKGSLPMSDENRNRISSAIAKYTPAQRAEFAEAFTSAREEAIADYTDKGYNAEAVDAAILGMGTKIKSTDPKKIAAHAVKAIFADRVLLNPMLLTPDKPLSDDEEAGTADTKKATERVGQAMTRFTKASKRERELMSKRIDEAIAEAPRGSAKHEELLAVKFSLDVTNALRANERDEDADEDEDGDGDGKEKPIKPPKGLSKVQFGLLQHFADDPKKSSELLGLSFRASRKDKTATEDTRKFVRKATSTMKPEQINALLPEEMQSVSLAVNGLLKDMASERAAFRKSRGKSTNKEDAEIAEYDASMKETGKVLGARLADVVAETINRKVDPKKTKALATGIRTLHDERKESGAVKSGKGSDEDFFARLQALFNKFLGGESSSRPVTASLALPRYGFPSSVGGLYVR